MTCNYLLLKAIREKYYSQSNLAKELGIHKANISRIVRRKRRPTPELMHILMHKLGVPASIFA